MFVLGIDPGLTLTGYGVIDATRKKYRVAAAGVIRTRTDNSVGSRLTEIYRDLKGLLAEYQPKEAAIEQVFVNKNRNTAIGVARSSGVALLALNEAGIPVSEYSPTAVKMALCGNGRAEKTQVRRVVAMRMSLDGLPTSADAADALAIALCHLQHAPMQRAIGKTR
tara:strand:+ start:49 stop:546 length:498 start_codon:yes stop_codon:yes gene_type:complete